MRPDKVIGDIADYAAHYQPKSKLARQTARFALLDSLGCAFEALSYPACTQLLGPIVTGIDVPHGARVPGTSFQLDPVRAAFNIGAMIRWLDYSDWIFGENGGHPSDNLGAILATADYVSRRNIARGIAALTMRDVLDAIIKAYEIQGSLGMRNAFTTLGIDNTMLVKIASCALAAKLLGCNRDEIAAAVSNAFLDGHPLALYRRPSHTGSRKSWAGGDATSRGVWLALMAAKGEMGYPEALTAPRWGFYDVLFKGKRFKFPRPYGSYIIENVLFKIGYPAAFHGQSAVEAAINLYPLLKHKLDDIERIEVRCHSKAMMILNRAGPLPNPAARDHCLQYMIAVSMIHGTLTADSYQDSAAADPRIHRLRAKMTLAADPRFDRDFNDPEKRSNANAVQVHFNDGSKTAISKIEYPLGHRRRRKDGLPLLIQKFEVNLARIFSPKRAAAILKVGLAQRQLEALPVNEFIDLVAL